VVEKYHRPHPGELQRPRLRSAAFGVVGVSLRHQRAGLVSGIRQSRSTSPAAATTWPPIFDLCELLTNFRLDAIYRRAELGGQHPRQAGKNGRSRRHGPGHVRRWPAGRINDYCRCDVLDTYFVFLRTRVLLGQLALDAEQQLIAQTKQWLESKAASSPAYQTYLSHWGDWLNPWAKNDLMAEVYRRV